jgi:hypothetical protein
VVIQYISFHPTLQHRLAAVPELVNRGYYDIVTGEKMLLRAVIEETESEIAVITLYNTSKLKKYLPEEAP